jgi:hypothetical protein
MIVVAITAIQVDDFDLRFSRRSNNDLISQATPARAASDRRFIVI